MKILCKRLILLFFIALNACHAPKEPTLGLDQLNLEGIEHKEDFLQALSELVGGQGACKFSQELLERITFGTDGYPRQGHYVPTKQACIRNVAVHELSVDEHSGVSIFLSGKPHGTYHVLALLEGDRWIFYWPEPIGVENPVIR